MLAKVLVPSLRAVRPTRAIQSARAFSTTSLNRDQFIVIARDYTDPDALKRRLSVRPKHLEGANELKKSGKLHLGGALLSDHSDTGRMVGSVMIFNADSIQEVKEIVERDQYVTGKVWEHYDIIPFRQAKV
ncbi:hypothetical protein BGZ76_008084 [Entomortierella beljakovae]|nr:hypothetical protein BGZ76_008084 [Entomortierella beljakovae]